MIKPLSFVRVFSRNGKRVSGRVYFQVNLLTHYQRCFSSTHAFIRCNSWIVTTDIVVLHSNIIQVGFQFLSFLVLKLGCVRTKQRISDQGEIDEKHKHHIEFIESRENSPVAL